MLSERKWALINWSRKETKIESIFMPHIRLQKFLFFYECFSKVESDEFSFENLKGYKRGPVFSDVFGENKYNQEAFFSYVYQGDYFINESRAKRALFLTQILGVNLSKFTHDLDIWKSKKNEIMRGDYQVSLFSSDFSESDSKIFLDLESMYSSEFIDSVKVFEANGKAFLFPKKYKFEDKYYDVIFEASIDEDFHSPIYMDVTNGEIIID